MNKELQPIIHHLKDVLDGTPWFGRPVYAILDETDPATAAINPGKTGHSALELLYHMLTWTEFTLERVQGTKAMDDETTEKLDWRKIDPQKHSWEKGLAGFKAANNRIITLLGEKNDSFLDEKVDYRTYNFRVLLNGLAQHHIYHLGQIAYISKYLL